MSKYHSLGGWFLDITTWPRTGGRHSIQVPAGEDLLGWMALQKMILSFTKDRINPQNQPPPPSSTHPSSSKTFVEAARLKNTSARIISNEEVFEPCLPSLQVLTRLFANCSWFAVKKTLEAHFKTRISINPFMDDKALIKFEKVLERSLFAGSWEQYGEIFLKMENWSEASHSVPEVITGYGGWIEIKNLPLHLWKKEIFEAIGYYFGGRIKIASQTRNFIDISKAIICVKQNRCDFIPASIPISQGNETILTLKYGDIKPLKTSSPNLTPLQPLSVEDFSNPLDIHRICLALNIENSSPPAISLNPQPEHESLQPSPTITSPELIISAPAVSRPLVSLTLPASHATPSVPLTCRTSECSHSDPTTRCEKLMSDSKKEKSLQNLNSPPNSPPLQTPTGISLNHLNNSTTEAQSSAVSHAKTSCSRVYSRRKKGSFNTAAISVMKSLSLPEIEHPAHLTLSLAGPHISADNDSQQQNYQPPAPLSPRSQSIFTQGLFRILVSRKLLLLIQILTPT